MTKVFGCSDDLLEIEGSQYPDDEIGCYDSEVVIAFVDGTVIRCGYGKPDLGVWYIKVEHQGEAAQTLNICEDEDADVYSDIFEIDAEIAEHWVIDKNTALPQQALQMMEQKRADDEFFQGAQQAIYELMKELDVSGSNEIRKLASVDDMCAAAAERIRERFASNKENAVHPDSEDGILACPVCKSGEFLENEDGTENRYCGQCGQRLIWNGEEE